MKCFEQMFTYVNKKKSMIVFLSKPTKALVQHMILSKKFRNRFIRNKNQRNCSDSQKYYCGKYESLLRYQRAQEIAATGSGDR